MAAPTSPAVASPTPPPVTTLKANDPRKNEDGTLKLGLKMATIFVGDQVEPFIIHHALITASSDYFAKALDGEFKEKEGVVRLEDQDPTTFASYTQWLYNNAVVPVGEIGEKYRAILHQYIFGNYIQDRGYSNAVIDAFICLTDKTNFYPIALTQQAWVSLPESCPLLTLLVDFWVNISHADWYRNEDGSWESGDVTQGPIEFWRRVALDLVNNPKGTKPGSYPWEINRCQYHEHKDGEPKCV
ncbi:hypothetical protein E6O75_ATG00753 [Venturia nashicola]|uniref:BTB domain-containing protein n=1 Tax=Venturia nashicola TaxID=86259 RepID=A0A4Z1PHB7_9PEZI|nr:hypothetical protein E6O75_ATG00753 [Venturia nashicola]